MAITERSVIPAGARVEIARSRYPSDPALVGRAGTVLEHSPYTPNKVEVQLDGEAAIRTFAPVELLVAATPTAALAPDEEAARKRLARP